jgi:DNA-directed RNA polymerase subunit K
MEQKKLKEQFTKYEVARIIGARALQIAMNAPILVKLTKEDLEKIRYDSLKIAEIEFESGVLPISVKRPFPEKKEEKLKRIKEKTIKEEEIVEKEIEEEKEIAKEGEIMGLVNEEDELEESYQEEQEEVF